MCMGGVGVRVMYVRHVYVHVTCMDIWACMGMCSGVRSWDGERLSCAEIDCVTAMRTKIATVRSHSVLAFRSRMR